MKEIAESISRHNFTSAYEFLADDVTWNMIGGEEIQGKSDVIKACEESATYLSKVTTTFNKFKTVVGEKTVVIDSAAEYIDEKNEKSVVSSCDIYEFEGNKIITITSYNIEIPQTN